jgi:hypothetical protein
MRIALIILGLTVIAVGLVHLRRQEVLVRHEIQRLESEHARTRREVWRREVELAKTFSPEEIRRRAKAMALEMTGDGQSLLPSESRPVRAATDSAATPGTVRIRTYQTPRESHTASR